MRVKIISILIPLFYILSCSSFFSSEYLEVCYYTPKFLPSRQTILILKNNHEYVETGSPGGISTDNISSKWYLIKYNIDNDTFSEVRIKGLDYDPFWKGKGITAANDSSVSIVSYDHVFIFNIYTNQIDTIPENSHNDSDIKNAYCTSDNQNIIVLRGFFSYSLSSFNVYTNSFTELVSLNSYYPDIVASCHVNNDFFILGHYNLENEIVLINSVNNTPQNIPYTAKFAYIYDNNKVAILQPENDILFLSVASDTITQDDRLTLNSNTPFNFSVTKSLDFLVYEDSNSIMLRDIENETEKVLFSDRRTEQ